MRWNIQISEGARRSYSSLGEAQDPPAEVFQPLIHPAAELFPDNVAVLPPVNWDETDDGPVPPIFLMRQENATKAYALVGKQWVYNHYHRWSQKIVAVEYERDTSRSTDVFYAPDASYAVWVTIERIHKAKLDHYLNEQNGTVNPYKNIVRTRDEALGDDQHVLSIRDVLEDDTFLYIVTRKPCDLGTLTESIDWYEYTTEEQTQTARKIYRKLLRIVVYLEENGLCHRDLSPDNFLFLEEDNLVLSDLSLSERLPLEMIPGPRTLMSPQDNSGNVCFQAPEAYRRQEMDGVFADLWSITVLLYALLTNHRLYFLPGDLWYRHAIEAHGLSRDYVINEQARDLLDEIDQMEFRRFIIHEELSRRFLAHWRMDDNARELLENVLTPRPEDRWTLAQAIRSAFVQFPDTP